MGRPFFFFPVSKFHFELSFWNAKEWFWSIEMHVNALLCKFIQYVILFGLCVSWYPHRNTLFFMTNWVTFIPHFQTNLGLKLWPAWLSVQSDLERPLLSWSDIFGLCLERLHRQAAVRFLQYYLYKWLYFVLTIHIWLWVGLKTSTSKRLSEISASRFYKKNLTEIASFFL